MKYLLRTCFFAVTISMGLISCEDFLDRPDKSQYTLSDFFQNDEQCLQAVNVLYSSPWHDFTRGWLGVGDMQSGNYYESANGYWKLTPLDGTIDGDLADMSAALWSVVARANTTIENIDMYHGSATTEAGRNLAKGEALVWKAMANFYMVRIFGAIPIVHDNSKLMATGQYNQLFRAKVENVYDYIIMTLEQAIQWLPEQNKSGRIDRYSAYGLLAKVYLAKSGYGRSGDRNQADLDKAKEYAAKVIHESGRSLEPVYSNIFRGSYNYTPEALISWRWISEATEWTSANPLKSDLAPGGMDEFGTSGAWGDWRGPSLDLQAAFGEDALRLTRNNTDKRRKATMMMYGDVYEYFWRDHPVKSGTDGNPVSFPNGFDVTKYWLELQGDFRSPTGANCVKHLVGNNADHLAEMGVPIADRMCNGLATHILRLADVYLIYAEAILGNTASTSDDEALRVFNEVRKRAGVSEKTTLTFDDIFKERRLELAFEGDFWYDFVRLSYYKPNDALAILNAQNRKSYAGLAYGSYYKDGIEGNITVGDDGVPSPRIDETVPTGQPYQSSVFTMPFPRQDLLMNPNLLEDPVDYDLSQFTY